MRETDFAYSVGRVRAAENHLIPAAGFETLLGAVDLTECMRLLSDFGYTFSGNEDFETALKEEEKKTWNFLYEITPVKSIFSMFLLKNDFHNAKAVIKGIVNSKNYETLLKEPYQIDTKLMEKCVIDNDFASLPPYISSAAKDAFDVICSSGDTRLFEIILDKAYLLELNSSAKVTKNLYLIKLAEIIIDTSNLIAALRMSRESASLESVQKAVISAGSLNLHELAVAASMDICESVCEFIQKSHYSKGSEYAQKSIFDFEKWCDKLILSHVLSASLKAFGPEPLIAYVYQKKNELSNVRIILSGRANNLPYDLVKERLRLYA